jgi:FXSXX-COOH protein
MDHDEPLRETTVIDLTGVDLDSLPEVATNVFQASLRQILDEQGDQPEAYLGFMSAFGSDG